MGSRQRVPLWKEGGTAAPYSATSGRKALERSKAVLLGPRTTMPRSAAALPGLGLPAQGCGFTNAAALAAV